MTSRADRYKDECSSVREELGTLKLENSNLRVKLGQIQTDEELRCKLKECQCKLESSEVDLDDLLTENLELKRVIRQEKKEIKRLQSRLVACSPVNESLVEDSTETAEVPSLDIIVQGLICTDWRIHSPLEVQSHFSCKYLPLVLENCNPNSRLQTRSTWAQERGKTDIVLMSKTEAYRRVLSSYISSELGKHVQEYV